MRVVDPILLDDGPVRLAFTTRRGGVSEGPFAGLNVGATGGDRREAVRANRRALAGALDLDAERVTMVHQVHGARVRTADAPLRPGRFLGALAGWPEGDGLVTRTPGIALCVMGADCLPVLLWRRDVPAVAAVHAGWRGLVDGVLGVAVNALGRPELVAAAVGPGVGPCCYPVDAPLRDRFAVAFGPDTVRGAAVDLALAARRALGDAGVPATAVHVVPACTSCEADRFYSYRRDGAATGRQAGLAWVDPAILRG